MHTITSKKGGVTMKKLLAMTLALLMVFALVACGSTSDDKSNNGGSGNVAPVVNSEIQDYIDQNKSALLSSMESSFASSSGMTCSSSIKAQGNGMIISININELDDVDSATKNTLQSTYDSMQSTFDALLTQMQSEVSSLEYFTINVCEKDGDLLATITARD